MSNIRVIAIIDSCVFYQSGLRNLFMYLATLEILWARWTEAIHEEWMRSVQRDYPDLTRQQVERIRDLMNAHAPDCLVSNYEELIPARTLPDPDDRHVLAAAIRARANVIVTFNRAHFPPETLAKYDLKALHPDEFISRLLDLDFEAVCAATRQHRESLKKRPMSVDQDLDDRERRGLKQTVAVLRQFSERI